MAKSKTKSQGSKNKPVLANVEITPRFDESGTKSPQLELWKWLPLLIHIKSGSGKNRTNEIPDTSTAVREMLVENGCEVVPLAWVKNEDNAKSLANWSPWGDGPKGVAPAFLALLAKPTKSDPLTIDGLAINEDLSNVPVPRSLEDLFQRSTLIPWAFKPRQNTSKEVKDAIWPYLEVHAAARNGESIIPYLGQPFGAFTVKTAEAAKAAYRLKNIVLEGVAGIGKTYILSELCKAIAGLPVRIKHLEVLELPPEKPEDFAAVAAAKRELKELEETGGTAPVPITTTIVLHPSSSYEDLVIGLRPDGDQSFEKVPGPLLKAIRDAQQSYGRLQSDGARNYTTPHVIILDEINRCNLPSVLGELMLVLDPSKRVTESLFTKDFNEFQDSGREEAVRRGYAVKLLSEEERDPKKWDGLLWVPDNVYVIGTMNSSDRSILGFDQALRRRFPPIRLEPHSIDDWCTQLQEWVKASPDLEANLKVAYQEIVAWAAINVMLRARIGPDAMIGHSYIYEALEHRNESEPNLRAAFERMWQYGILPQVIHSAESSRQIDFACHMFDKNESSKFFDEDTTLAVAKTHIDEAIKAVLGASANFDNFKGLCEIAGVAGASPCRQHKLVVAGQGHGRRLLVKRADTNSDAIKNWCEQLAKSTFPMPPWLTALESNPEEANTDGSENS